MSRSESVRAFSEKLHHVLRDDMEDKRRMAEAMCDLVDKDCVRHNVLRAHYDARRASRHERDGHVGLEQDLRHAFAIVLGVQKKTFREKDRMFLWRSPGIRKVCVPHSVAGVHHEGHRTSRSGQRQYSLARHVKGGHVQVLEHGGHVGLKQEEACVMRSRRPWCISKQRSITLCARRGKSRWGLRLGNKIEPQQSKKKSTHCRRDQTVRS